MKPIVLIGPGGHCRSCIDVIESAGLYEIVAIVGQPHERGQAMLGYKIQHDDSDLPALVQRYPNYLITVGQIKSSAIRVRLFDAARSLGAEFPSIVSPLAHVSKHAELGAGTIVMHGAIVNAAARVGENCIINSKALIEHDAQIGNHCHISTGAIINGATKVNDHCFIGSGAVARQSIEIKANSVIGATTWISGNKAP